MHPCEKLAPDNPAYLRPPNGSWSGGGRGGCTGLDVVLAAPAKGVVRGGARTGAMALALAAALAAGGGVAVAGRGVAVAGRGLAVGVVAPSDSRAALGGASGCRGGGCFKKK